MPVMIDEALVNFDPERAEAAAGVLAILLMLLRSAVHAILTD